jgi:Cd2+/Zn2+-exporting ATPase
VGAFHRALGWLIAAAPCALSVTPLAYVVAVSACARRGVLLRGGDVLDAVAGCATLALDKTGTLTTGRLTSTSVQPLCCTQLEVRPQTRRPSDE